MYRVALLVALVLSFTAAPIIAQDCGHCHEQKQGGSWYHQMTDDSPATHQCSGGPGHYVHDCVEGDGSTWAYDPCEPDHDDDGCGFENLAILQGSQTLDVIAAEELAAEFPDQFSYEMGTQWAFVNGCGDRLIAAVPIERVE